MSELIINYLVSYADGIISVDRLREDLSNPDIVLQQDLADALMDLVDRGILRTFLPQEWYYTPIQIPIIWK